MARALAMARLATDADLGKMRGKAIMHSVIILVHICRMAFGAHEVPVLIQLGPMQNIVMSDPFVWIEMEPALAALLFRPRIPRDRQSLEPSIGKFHEILLQRVDAEGIFDFKSRKLSIRPIGFDEKLVVLVKEARMYPEIIEARIGEIAEHCRVSRMRHSMLVLRHLPGLRLRLVAGGASLTADESERCQEPWCEALIRTARTFEILKSEAADRNEQSGQDHADPDHALREHADGRAGRWYFLGR